MIRGKGLREYGRGKDLVYMENRKYEGGNGKMGMRYRIVGRGKKYEVYGMEVGDMVWYGEWRFGVGKG